MQNLLDRLLAEGWFPGVPVDVVYAGGMLAAAVVVVLGFVLLVSGITTFVERRVWARIQNRVGPNRVGPQGILQWMADGLKLLMKEDLIPAAADARLFRLAPYLVVVGFVSTFVVVPFGSQLVVADLDLGLVYLTAVTSLVVVGILMAGWASNNKWSLFGGIRAAAQIISYEIPAALSLLPVILMVGSLSLQEVIRAQGWAPWDWHVFANPFSFVALFLFFTAALAEANRTPFDLPEADTELVGGFVTEYSGVRYLMFFLVEWGNLYVIGAIVTTVFLGGWQVPPVTEHWFLRPFLEFLTFFVKSYFWVFVAMWIRGTLPRVRVDQLMGICWKYLVPLAFLNLLGAALWVALLPHGSRVASLLLFALGVLLIGQFARRVRFYLRRARARERGELSWNPIV